MRGFLEWSVVAAFLLKSGVADNQQSKTKPNESVHTTLGKGGNASAAPCILVSGLNDLLVCNLASR